MGPAEQLAYASELGYLPVARADEAQVVAVPVSLGTGTFLAKAEDPRARALAAVMAINNLYVSSSSSARI